MWGWGSKPTPVPNANGFASQWNIGLKVLDPETFNDNSLSTIATAAIAEINFTEINVPFMKYRQMSLKEYTFCNDNI